MPFKKGKSGNKATQIKKGQVLNPTGRPKGKTFRTRIQEASLQKIDYNNLKKEDTKGEAGDGIIIQLFKRALGGDIAAARLILEHAEGKTNILEGGDQDKPILTKPDFSSLSDEDIKRFASAISQGDD